jgi:hypothetical protein
MHERVVAARNRRVLLVWLVSAWAATAACAAPTAGSGEERVPRAASASFAVYALSRGRGVPEATRSAWQRVLAMLEDARRDGTAVRLQQTRIGLEGEVRLCAEFADAARAREMLERARAVAVGVELLNVVEEPCAGS